MNYNEGINLLDDPIDGEDYGNKQLRSESRGLWLLKDKYGISYCTPNWPVDFHPKPEDLAATDWRIFDPAKR